MMNPKSFLSVLFAAFPSLVLSSPLEKRSATTPAGTLITSLFSSDPSGNLIDLSSSQETALNLQLAASLSAAAYCSSVRSGSWNCYYCGDLPDVQLLYVAGDGGSIAKVYVGYSPSKRWLIVSHEGTELNISAWLNDLDFAFTGLDPSLNNGAAGSGVQVHEGFQAEFLQTSSAVLSAVKSALSGVASKASLVLVTGHSLGAALGTFEALHLRNNLASTVPIQMVGFGQPRIGNPAFVTYYQSIMGNNHLHYTNENDIVPHVPPEDFGFEQTNNEIFYDGDYTWLCPGLENDDCSNSYFIDYSPIPHLGPYFDHVVFPLC